MSAPSWQNLLAQLNAPALSQPIRQAISYATNYPGIIAALSGAAVPSSGIVPAGLFGHFTDLPSYSYDPAKAAKLLNSAGYGPGKKKLNLSLTYTAGDSNEQVVATLLKSSLAKLNVNLTVQPLAWATQWGKGKSSSAKARQDIFMEYWWPDYADPYSWFVNLLLTEKQPFFNLSYYSNPALDKQINRVESLVATDPSAGSALYKIDAGRDLEAGADRVLVQLQLPVRDDEHVLRLPGEPGLPERHLRLQPQAVGPCWSSSRAGSRSPSWWSWASSW